MMRGSGLRLAMVFSFCRLRLSARRAYTRALSRKRVLRRDADRGVEQVRLVHGQELLIAVARIREIAQALRHHQLLDFLDAVVDGAARHEADLACLVSLDAIVAQILELLL